MRNTLYPMVAGVAMIAVLGMVAPVRAHANDTGAALLGVAAGLLVGSLLDRNSDNLCDDYAYRTTDPRCYLSGGHWYWRAGVDRRPEELYGQRAYTADIHRNDRTTRDWDQRKGRTQQQAHDQGNRGNK